MFVVLETGTTDEGSNMASHALVILLGIFSIFVQFSTSEYVVPKKRFEYKHSFKGPHLVSKDGTIPFWEHGGHAIASDESVRVTPSLKSKKGWIWNKVENTNKFWQVDLKFRVTGRGRIGADGLAMWFTTERAMEGPVFGNKDMWNGMAVIFDSFDNDQQHNNPYIMALTNDGTKKYNHGGDGIDQQLGGCMRDFRNKPFPVAARILYYDNTIEIYFHGGMSQNAEDFELCMRAGNVVLPEKGYFGVSAATGGIADDHDVVSFLTHSLMAPPKDAPVGGAQVSDDEKKKLEKEFDEYWDKLQKAKESYKKEHPEKQGHEENEDAEDAKWFEDQKERELKQIFEGQDGMHTQLRELSKKLDIIIGQNERTISSLSSVGNVQQQQGGGKPTGGVVVDTMKRHEVDEVLRHLRDSSSQVVTMRQILDEVNSRTASIPEKMQQIQQGGNAGGNVFDHEMKDNMNFVRDHVTKIYQVQSSRMPACPEISCLSFGNFLLFSVAQTLVLVGYMVYRSRQDAAAKKFY